MDNQGKQQGNYRASPVQFGLWPAIAGIATVLVPSQAYAALDAVSSALCFAILAVESNLGRAIATIAVISLGIGALFGKITWMQGIIVATGIGVIFGAIGIVDMLTTGGAWSCTNPN